MAEERVELDQEVVDAFGAKLNAWAQTLEPMEQALLGTLIARASGGSEVEGYAMGSMGESTFSFMSPLGGTSKKKGKEVIEISTTNDGGAWLKGGTA